LEVLKPAYAFPWSLPVLSSAAHHFSNSGSEVCEENTLGFPKVSLFRNAPQKRSSLTFVVYFSPKHENDLWSEQEA
jgi:hypothetical protein